MSIRGAILAITLTLSALLVAVIAELIVSATWINRATVDLAAATQGVLAAEELEVHLFHFAQERLLARATPTLQHVLNRDTALSELTSWLAVLKEQFAVGTERE